nr:VOC family protein [Evansella caseinilytica]
MVIGINPYLIFDGKGQEATKFYQSALDATVVGIQTYGELPENPDAPLADEKKNLIVHAHLKIGGTDLMISDEFPGSCTQSEAKVSHITIAVMTDNVKNTEEVFGKLQVGGEIVLPLQKTFFSPSYGQVMDKFGVTWHVSTQAAETN